MVTKTVILHIILQSTEKKKEGHSGLEQHVDE